jgi:hypothetical protein
MNLAGGLEEEIAFLAGQLASYDLVVSKLLPSRERLKKLHELRVAAKIDPSAAYTLGKLLGERHEKTGRKSTLRAALSMYEASATTGIERLRNPQEPFAKAPKREKALRDIISRSLTNIGAELSNSGFPDKATEYFRQSVQIFPKNTNAHICLGRMGIFFSDITGVDELDGISSWEKATKLDDFCEESHSGCPCRIAFVKIARQIERDYGDVHARSWVKRAAKSMGRRKRMGSFVPVAWSMFDAGEKISSKADVSEIFDEAAELADALEDLFGPMRDQPVELKVTVAATLLMTFLFETKEGFKIDVAAIADAKQLMSEVEPLHPFLGDDEWVDIGMPATRYLLQRDIKDVIMSAIQRFHSDYYDLIEEAPMVGLAAAVFFHLDAGFRDGVAAMVEWTVRDNGLRHIYLPGLYVGDPDAKAKA